MFDGIKERWRNRGTRCLKCQKKLVSKEKWVCKKCRTEMMTEGAVATLILTLTGRGINNHNKKG